MSGAVHYWAAELSQIYPALKKLEAQGFVKSRQAPAIRGPKRRVYERTSAGLVELSDWVQSGAAVATQKMAYVAQIEFAHETGNLSAVAELVTELREHFAPIHELLREADADLAAGDSDHDFHALLAVRLGLATLQARLTWCDEAEALIAERAG